MKRYRGVTHPNRKLFSVRRAEHERQSKAFCALHLRRPLEDKSLAALLTTHARSSPPELIRHLITHIAQKVESEGGGGGVPAETYDSWTSKFPPLMPILQPTLTREELAGVDMSQNAYYINDLLTVVVQNAVHATYLVDTSTGKRATLPIDLIRRTTQPMGPQHTTRKFAKLMLRNASPFEVSHSIFAGGRIVETGSVNSEVALIMIKQTVRMLREGLGLTNLAIESRSCENMVASGELPFSLCLELLEYREPGIVHTKTHFAGAIVSHPDLVCTLLVFRKGSIICVGARNQEQIVHAFQTIYAILVNYKETPANLAAQRRARTMLRRRPGRPRVKAKAKTKTRAIPSTPPAQTATPSYVLPSLFDDPSPSNDAAALDALLNARFDDVAVAFDALRPA